MTDATPQRTMLSFRRANIKKHSLTRIGFNHHQPTGHQDHSIDSIIMPYQLPTMPPLIPTLSHDIEHMTLSSVSQSRNTSNSATTKRLPFVMLEPKFRHRSLPPNPSCDVSNREPTFTERRAEAVQHMKHVSMLKKQESTYFVASNEKRLNSPTLSAKVKSLDGYPNFARKEAGSRCADAPMSPPRSMTLKRRRCSDSIESLDGNLIDPSSVKRRLPLLPHF